MLSLLMFVVQNKICLTNNENHILDTRQRNNFLPSSSKLNHLSKRSL